ncbi:MAG: 5'/3'-nucleotidase SurE [Caldiserica bacterium]|nr:5'/3'-nucleotidase SurE [Caldisericota bacterium]
MHILVTNDDGLWAQGIQALVAAIPAEHNVSVVAPASPQSAVGHSLTMHKPLRATRVENYVHPGVNAWTVSGTPVDCMMLGLDALVKQKVDIVFSGINHGDNLGDDLPYSGTVSGAYEAFVSGYPSVAFSTAFPPAGSSGFDFSPIVWFLQKMFSLLPDLIGINQHLTKSFSNSLNGSLFLNVNAPNCPASEVKGIRVVRQGRRRYAHRVTPSVDQFGAPIYWIGGDVPPIPQEDTDVTAVANGYISVTPLGIDLTDYVLLERLQQLGTFAAITPVPPEADRH